jgi:AraC-like DNA-binding protein
MHAITRPLLLLHPDKVFRQRVHEVSGERFDVQSVATWAELRDAIRESAPAALAVVDPYTEADDDGKPSPALRSFLLDYSSTTVIAALKVHPQEFRNLHTIGAWGVADIIGLEHDATAEAIEQLLASLSGTPLRALLERFLPSNMPGRARSIVLMGADVVSVGGHADDLARALGVTRRTLLRWCDSAGLPPPRRLMTWMRLLLAAEMLDERGRTVASIGVACGYVSDVALRTALRMQLGKTPKELRREGAFATASHAFLDELRRARTHADAVSTADESSGESIAGGPKSGRHT